jgi:hypothetical protein
MISPSSGEPAFKALKVAPCPTEKLTPCEANPLNVALPVKEHVPAFTRIETFCTFWFADMLNDPPVSEYDHMLVAPAMI